MAVETGNFLIVEVKLKELSQLEKINELAINEFAVDGMEEFSIDEPLVDEILGERAYSGGDVPEEVIYEVEVTTKETQNLTYNFYFFNGDINRGVSFANFLTENLDLESVAHKTEEYSDWNEEWRKHYAPIKVESDLHVVPEWYKEDDYLENKNNIYINPGMGFGTGEHETTYLCLKLFNTIKDELADKSLCLDFGCGSGILGIGAIKKSNCIVDFVDIDPEALDNNLTNLKLNFKESDLNGHRLILRDRFELADKYKLVYANILEHVLISERDLLLKSLDDDAYLVLSGILNDQVENIKKEYSSLECISVLSKGDWSAILMKKA